MKIPQFRLRIIFMVMNLLPVIEYIPKVNWTFRWLFIQLWCGLNTEHKFFVKVDPPQKVNKYE